MARWFGVRWLATVLTAAAMAVPLVGVTAAAVPAWGWSTPALAEHDQSGHAHDQVMSANRAGNAVLAWSQFDGLAYKVYASLYTDTGWAGPTLLDSAPGTSQNPQAFIDDAGNALVVWAQFDGFNWNLTSARHRAGQNWATPVLAEDTGLFDFYGVNVLPFRLVGSPNGNASLVWVSDDSGFDTVWVSRFSPAYGWASSFTVTVDGVDVWNDISAFGATALADGGVAVVFSADNGTGMYLPYENRTGPTGQWQGVFGINAPFRTVWASLEVAADGTGDLVAVWGTSASPYSAADQVWTSRSIGPGLWSPSQELSAVHARVYDVKLVEDGRGTFTAAWNQQTGQEVHLWTARYASGFGWQVAAVMGGLTAPSAGKLNVAANNGTTAVGWRQDFDNVWNAYVVLGDGVSWQDPKAVDTLNFDVPTAPAVAVTGSGGAFAAWMQGKDGVYDMNVARYGPGLTPLTVTIAGPQDGTTSAAPTADLYGWATPNATVAVDGQFVSVSADGTWQTHVALVPGANAIKVEAWDIAHNYANATVNVTYADAAAALQANLTTAQSQLAAAQAQLTAARADLNATQANVTAAQAAVASAQAAVTAAQARVDTLNTQLTTAQGQISKLQTDLAAANASAQAASASAAAANNAAQSGGGSSTLGLLGVVLGAAGIAAAVVLSRNKPPAAAPSAPSEPPKSS